MKSFLLFAPTLLVCWIDGSVSFNLQMMSNKMSVQVVKNDNNNNNNRRNFLSTGVAIALGIATPFVNDKNNNVVHAAVAASTAAAPEIKKTNSGIKYAVLKQPKENRTPLDRDIVAIEYTGYLTDGTIFDSTHAEGKKNALMFQVGSTAVIDGLNDIVKYMGVGEKVQAIIPADLAFGEKGICIESGECLVKPKATLVYDIYLKRSAIPPP